MDDNNIAINTSSELNSLLYALKIGVSGSSAAKSRVSQSVGRSFVRSVIGSVGWPVGRSLVRSFVCLSLSVTAKSVLYLIIQWFRPYKGSENDRDAKSTLFLRTSFLRTRPSDFLNNMNNLNLIWVKLRTEQKRIFFRIRLFLPPMLTT